uniref:Nucleoprotein n=1 Tax=Astopletus virus TaxID=2800905 RepID=A0A894KKW8_9VIRU|nr:MAG: nucleoprotein [Astopletus virus]QRW42563.1 MAG: nucleoprotein [Astopletus virus]
MSDNEETNPDATAMEVGERTVTKRKIVNVDGAEIPDPKRSRAPVNHQFKHDVWSFILHFHEALRIHWEIPTWTNIDDMADITSAMHTVHNRKRQSVRAAGTILTRLGPATAVTVGGVIKPLDEVIKIYDAVLAKHPSIVYEDSARGRDSAGGLGSILTLIAAYKDRFNEVRVGMGKVTLTKTEGVVSDIPIAMFGLESYHQVTLKGCSYSPIKQSSMKNTLGPMTVAINLACTTDSRFAKSWRDTFCNMFKLVPNHVDIANVLQGSKGNEHSLMRALGDLCLTGITRGANKAHFPMAMVMSLCHKKPEYHNLFTNSDLTRIVGLEGHTITRALPTVIKNIDFSGHGALGFWNVSGRCDKYTMRGEMPQQMCSEMLFHAVWGTHTEDLGYLQWLTDHRFLNRNDIDKRLQSRGSSGKTCNPIPIIFKRFSKMANAALNNTVSGTAGQVVAMPTFSGMRRSDVELDHPLLKILSGQQQSVSVGGNMDASRLVNVLLTLKAKIEKGIRENKCLMLGTTKHFSYDETTDGAAYGPEIDELPTLSNTFFYGA